MERDITVPPDKFLIGGDNSEMSGAGMDLSDPALGDIDNFNLAPGKLVVRKEKRSLVNAHVSSARRPQNKVPQNVYLHEGSQSFLSCG